MRNRRLTIENLHDRFAFSADPMIGINLDPIVDFGTSIPFTDAFKTSRPWMSHAYNTATGVESFSGGGPVLTDENGWPVQLNSFLNDQGQLIQQRISTLMFRDIGDKFPAGIYRAHWKGQGIVKWQGAATEIERGVMEDGTNYALLQVTPRDAGISLRIESIVVDDPIRDIRVWLPDFEGQSFVGQEWDPGADFSPFHPAFLQKLEPFSTLRFMDWSETNRSKVVEWSDRRQVDDARQRGEGAGVAYEYIVELANSLQKDIWINLPHQASDDFNANLASYIHEHLDPTLKVHIEYSNEIWNGTFDAFHWITDRLPGGNPLLRWQVTAGEIVRDFDIWSQAFESSEDRLVRVVAGFTDQPQVTASILAAMDGKFDAIAVGSYVSLNANDLMTLSASSTADDVLDLAFANLVSRTVPRVVSHQVLAEQYSQSLGRQIDLTIYEGGQLLLPQTSSSSYLQAIYDAQTSPRMYDLYGKLFRELDLVGVDLFNHFTHIAKLTPASTTGALQHQFELPDSAPKFRALVDAADGVFFIPDLSVESVEVTEGSADFATLTVGVSDVYSKAFAVSIFATSGTAIGGGIDYGSASSEFELSTDGGLTWLSGSTFEIPPMAESFLVRVPIVDDAIIEADESFQVTVVGPSMAEVTATISIKNDDVADTTTALVSFWNFDSVTGIAVPDSAPFGSASDTATFAGSVAIANGQLDLSGMGALRVNATADLGIGIYPQRTVALSFLADDVVGRQVLFEEGGATRGLNLYIEGGRVHVGAWNVSSFQSNWSGNWVSAPILAGQWYDLALVLNGSSTIQPEALTGYLDGIEIGRAQGSQLWTHSDPVGIGGVQGESRFASAPNVALSGARFAGLIDDVRVYSRALNQTEVAALSGSIVEPPPPPPPQTVASITNAVDVEGQPLLFNINFSVPTTVPVTIAFSSLTGTATSGIDYVITDPTITVPAGATNAQFRVETIDDMIVEADEDIVLQVSILDGPASLTLDYVQGLIVNDDLPPPQLPTVAKWDFESSVNRIVDDAGSSGAVADRGTLLGDSEIVSGWGSGSSLKLSGIGRVAVASSTDINLLNISKRSISLWFYANNTTQRQVLFEEGAATTGIVLYLESGKVVLGAYSQFAVAGGWPGTWLSADVSPNRWHHVALVLDASNASMVGYLDGAEFARGLGRSVVSHADPIGIGAANGGARFQNVTTFNTGSSPFIGYIDDVSIYNDAISALDVARQAERLTSMLTGNQLRALSGAAFTSQMSFDRDSSGKKKTDEYHGVMVTLLF